MNIEFIGLPGVGKSWLCESLAESENGADLEVKLFPPVDRQPRSKVVTLKLLSALFFALRHPFRTWTIAGLSRRSGQSDRRDAYRKTLNLIAELGRQSWYRRSNAVFEQGVLQSIWSLALNAREADLDRLVRAAEPFLPGAVLHVEAGLQQLHRRLEQREGGRSRLDGVSRERRDELIERGRSLFGQLVSAWRRVRPGGHYREIDNSSGDPRVDVGAVVRDVFGMAGGETGDRGGAVAEKLAVLIPVYNDQEALEKTLGSIRETDNAFTVVVVDDGSARPIEVAAQDYPFEIVVLRNEPNGGIVSALNTGLEFVRREGFSLVARLDAADLNRPGRFAAQREMLASDPRLAMVGSNASFRDSDSGREIFATNLPLTPKKIRRWMAFRNCFIHPTVMIDLGRIPPSLDYSARFRHIEDYVLFSEITASRPCANIERVLVDCFVREGGISRSNDRSQLFAGVRHHLANPRPLNPLWYAYIVKRLAYMGVPYSWRTRLKQALNFVRPGEESEGAVPVRSEVAGRAH